MSSSPEFVRYLCEQLEGTGEVRFRKMFGEYWIYLNDRPAVLVCGSSLASYSVYLRLKYNYILYISGDYLVMFWEAAAMAAALIFCIVHLVILCVKKGETT